MHSEDLSAALCRAINNWIAAEWLDRDPRLRASIVVPVHSPDLAVAEIERRADDTRFVQVLMLRDDRDSRWAGGSTGRSIAAAERHGLPIGIHAGSSFRHPPSALGWPSYYIEDYVSQAPGFAGVLNSLVTEGVFNKFPRLKVVLIESGVTWLPAHFWRINKTWRGVRCGNPVARSPAVRDHPRACPADHPAVRRSAGATPGADHHRGDRLRRDAAVLDRLSALALRGHRRDPAGSAGCAWCRRSWSTTRWRPILVCRDA